MASTEEEHGETKIWVVRSRSLTWTSPAMLVKGNIKAVIHVLVFFCFIPTDGEYSTRSSYKNVLQFLIISDRDKNLTNFVLDQHLQLI